MSTFKLILILEVMIGTFHRTQFILSCHLVIAMICELAINAAVGMQHNEIPTGTIAFGCYGHKWLRYRQVSENPTHSSGNILFSAAQLETM